MQAYAPRGFLLLSPYLSRVLVITTAEVHSLSPKSSPQALRVFTWDATAVIVHVHDELRRVASPNYNATLCRSPPHPPPNYDYAHRQREEISGQRLWEGSLLLCAYLVETCCKSDNNSSESESCPRKSKLDLNGKSVLELGAGTGVVSMLAHRLGASPLVMTDGDERQGG